MMNKMKVFGRGQTSLRGGRLFHGCQVNSFLSAFNTAWTYVMKVHLYSGITYVCAQIMLVFTII